MSHPEGISYSEGNIISKARNISVESNISEAVSWSEEKWSLAAREHRTKIDGFVENHLKRRSQHRKDPITDFIFEYYNFRPSQLRQWSPGIGIELLGPTARNFLKQKEFELTSGGVCLSPGKFPARLLKSTRWIRDLLVATQDRTPRLGCAGMHEWAMVYGRDPVRHTDTPLRLERNEINDIVDVSALTCTHFDAFRFFTEAARPRNANFLRREDMFSSEQPGCLHTNMDVFKWAFKRYPWIPSDVIADAFFLANKIRVVDMRASPYDLLSVGLQPIRVETAEGREQYRTYQTAFYEETRRVRARLISSYNDLLNAISEPPAGFA